MSIKIRLTREAFVDTLAWPSRLMKRVPRHPVLGGVLLNAHVKDEDTDNATPAGVVTMSGYDWETSATSSTPADVLTSGRVLLSGRLLSSIAKVLPDADVELVADNEEARITAGTAEFVLPLLPVDDYPELPAMPLPFGEVDAAVWAEAVQRVAVATDPKGLDFATGVLVQINDGELRLVATDRYRLTEAVAPWQPALSDGTVRTLVVPVAALLEASRVIATASGTVTLAADDKATGLFGLFFGDQRMTTPVLDLTYPKYQQLIPTDFSYRAVVNVEDLADAVERVGVTASHAGEFVTLTFEPGRVRLSAGLRDYDGVARDSVPAEFEGDELSIRFDVTRFRSALATMHAESAELLFIGPTKAGILRPVVPATESGAFQHLVMPIRPPDEGQAA